MFRKLALGVVVLTLVAGIFVLGAEKALLGEMVSTPLACAAITGDSLEFAQNPAEEIAWSGRLASARYGLIPLGNSKDPGITIVEYAQPGGPPLLLLDADNDQVLDNNSWQVPEVRNGVRAYTWFVTVTVKYGEDPVIRLPYAISVYGEYSYKLGCYMYFYGGYSHRRGLVTIDGQKYALAVASMGSSGRYDKLETLVVAVDLDRDGELNSLPYSHEVFGPGAPIVFPTGTYSIIWASADGQEIHLQRDGEGAIRPIIARGEPIPSFESRGLNGELISVPSDDGKTTVLLFVHHLTVSDDPRHPEPALISGERVEDVRAALRGRDVELVVITEEEPADDLHFGGLGVVPHVVFDPAVNELYRRAVGVFVVDQQGIIVAMDETWWTWVEYAGHPKGDYQELRALEIREVVDALVLD